MREDRTFKALRDKHVAHLQLTLEQVKPTTAPRWFMATFCTPIFVWDFIKLVVRTLFSVAGATLFSAAHLCMVPVIATFLFVDMTMIQVWYYRRIIDKMCGGSK